jgi:histidinol-phosphatase
MALSRLHEYVEFAVQTAHEAGRLTLGYFRTELQPEMKADDSPVTAADRKAEELIRARIEHRFPGHRIVGEEFGSTGSDASAPCWWIDPIDGTKAFVRGVPLYGVLIGLEIENRIVAGAAYFPALDEMLYAADGSGCFLNGRRCRVSSTPSLARSIVSFTNRRRLSQRRLVRRLRPRPGGRGAPGAHAGPHHEPIRLRAFSGHPAGGRRLFRRLVRQRNHLRQ